MYKFRNFAALLIVGWDYKNNSKNMLLFCGVDYPKAGKYIAMFRTEAIFFL